MGRNVVVQMALTFILDIESKDVAVKVFPGWTPTDQCVLVLKNVTDAILKIGNAILV